MDRGGGGTGVEGAESGVEGAESGVEGREAGVEGAGSGDRGGGGLERLGREIDFFIENSKKNGSFMPISYIKVHHEKYAYLCGLFCHTTHVWRQ